MKNFFALFLLFVSITISWHCSGSVNTAAMNDKDRLQYALKTFNDADYEAALKEFEAVVLQFPGSEVVDDAQYYSGQCRFKRKEYLLAAYEFSKLIKSMASSTFVPEAQFMLASCYEQLSPAYPLDQKYTKKAIDEFQAFIDFFPADKRVPKADSTIKFLYEKLAEKEFHNAVIYERMEYYTAAIMTYGKVVDVYHDTKYAPSALLSKIKLLVYKNRKSDALQEISSFLTKYPKNESADEVKKIKTEIDSDTSVKKG